MISLKNKRVLIVGFGKSGHAAAKYCLENGAVVSVTDKDSVVAELALQKFGKASFATTYFGSHPASAFENTDIVIVSPGVSLTLDGIKNAKERGIPVVGEMELVLDKITAPVIAITGTNGKSTVTTLIGEILKEAGKNVLVGGNLGTPLIELVSQVTSNKSQVTDLIVLEVSSYQLEISPNFHPHIAVLLNITPDHLDRYSSYDEYIAAKALIVKNLNKNDHFIFNEGDPLVKKVAENCSAQKVGFKSGAAAGVNIDLTKVRLVGAHNLENMIASALAVQAAGCDPKFSQAVFEKFTGLPHRNQFVREVNGVKYFDDSKGTNVGAVVKSLEGFKSQVILIAGGLDKGGSYEPLRPLVKEKVKALILIGASREKIANALGDLTKTVLADSMAAAVRDAAALSTKGDIVLLSPACASMDMFKNYAHRGEEFVKEVMKLNS